MEPVTPTNSPYRDQKSTLAMRLERLHQELAVIRETRLEIEALAHREAEILAEMAKLTAEMAEISAKRQLPLLNLAYVASPCKADWNEMVGDDVTRYCGICKKQVHNLSQMAFDEAETFLRQLTGAACVRLYRRKDGTVMTNDCPVGVRNKRVKRAAGVLVGAGMAAAGIASLNGEDPNPQVMGGNAQVMGGIQSPPEMTVVQGDMAMPEREVRDMPMGVVAVPDFPPTVQRPDTGPQLLSGPSTPINPIGAKGTMVARCTITTLGQTRDCQIVAGPPSMHQAMRNMISQQRYLPATHQGKPIDKPHTIVARLEGSPARTGAPTGAIGAAGVAQPRKPSSFNF